MCSECGLPKQKCICEVASEILEANEELFEDLAELEAQEKPNARRCLGCYFFNCQCRKGLNAKASKPR